ncbi:MAG: SDR family oxidoreductase [Parvularculaceae bacterium]|nr:SDR family oxidoreductase [Parvularculaceae bacterium]
MTDKRLLCLGFGYVAGALAARLRREGWRVAGTARNSEKARALCARNVEPVHWKNGGAGALEFAAPAAVLVSTPPGEKGCPAYAAAERGVAKAAREISWIGYLSTNGVYGDHDGAWVDESSPLLATSPRAKNRIKAEAQWRDLGAALDIPVVVFRLPGIYGPGRSALDAVREGRARRIFKEGQVFSRAHVDDIAAALHASLSMPHAGELFNICDDEPAPPQDVIDYACKLLGVAPPPLTPIETAQLSPMAKSFYDDNKRVSNVRMKERLLPTLTYPTYRDGLDAIFAAARG